MSELLLMSEPLSRLVGGERPDARFAFYPPPSLPLFIM